MIKVSSFEVDREQRDASRVKINYVSSRYFPTQLFAFITTLVPRNNREKTAF